jgi:hypothetical protein
VNVGSGPDVSQAMNRLKSLFRKPQVARCVVQPARRPSGSLGSSPLVPTLQGYPIARPPR